MGKVKKVVKDEKLFLLIRNFLLTYLPVQRKASANTVTVYRTVLNQFLKFTSEQCGVAVSSVTFEHFSYELITDYLSSLLTEKGYSSATWNNRLAALKAFVAYAAACYPEYIALSAELAAIKAQRNDPFSKVDYLSEEAVRVLLREPDAATKLGLRDQMMLIFFYDTGARIQEVLNGHIRKIFEIELGYVMFNQPGVYHQQKEPMIEGRNTREELENNKFSRLDERSAARYYVKPMWRVNCLWVDSASGSLRDISSYTDDERNTLDYCQLLIDAQTGELVMESQAQDRCEFKGFISWDEVK